MMSAGILAPAAHPVIAAEPGLWSECLLTLFLVWRVGSAMAGWVAVQPIDEKRKTVVSGARTREPLDK